MKIVIAGNYGAKNIGDELILEGLISMLKDAFVEFAGYPEITVLSSDPKETEKKYNVDSVLKFPSGIRSFFGSLFKSSKTKKAVKNCDFFILGGGGLFTELSFKAYIIWGIQAFMAYLYKKPVIMYGQSIGPLSSRLSGKFKRWLVRKLFNKAAFIAVRDEESKKELKNIGVNQKIYVMPDLIFRITAKEKNPKDQSLSQKPVQKNKQVVIALRQLKPLTPSFLQEVANFLNWLVTKKYKLIFVDFQSGSDHLLHNEIIKRLSPEALSNYEYVSGIKNSAALFKLFSQSQFILGMRLHSILAAIKAQTPFIGINYAFKVRNFLKDAKLDKYLLDMDDLRLKEIYYLIQRQSTDGGFAIEKLLADLNTNALRRHRGIERELKNASAVFSGKRLT